jgi:hypothetical protein
LKGIGFVDIGVDVRRPYAVGTVLFSRVVGGGGVRRVETPTRIQVRTPNLWKRAPALWSPNLNYIKGFSTPDTAPTTPPLSFSVRAGSPAVARRPYSPTFAAAPY